MYYTAWIGRIHGGVLKKCSGSICSYISDILLESAVELILLRLHLICGPLDDTFIFNRLAQYGSEIHGRNPTLSKRIGFIDGAAIRIAHLTDSQEIRPAYKWHKCANRLKLQVLSATDELILHASSLTEVRRYDVRCIAEGPWKKKFIDALTSKTNSTTRTAMRRIWQFHGYYTNTKAKQTNEKKDINTDCS